MKRLSGTGLGLLATLAGCETERAATAGSGEAIVESPRASLVIDGLARSFPVLVRKAPTRLEVGSRGVRADPRELLPGLRVSLPERATDPLRLSDDPSGIEIGVTLEGAVRSELEIGGGFARFANAFGPGRDVLMKPRSDGVEDYVYFPERPANERIGYRVDVSRVKGVPDPGDLCLTQPADSCSTTGVCSAAGVWALHAATTPCGVYSCSGSTLDVFWCDGGGNCDPKAISCAPFACGKPGECGGKCPCSEGFFCSQDTCLPKQADGTGCLSGEQCTSGSCVDGFCCNTACDGQCEACDLNAHAGECWAVTDTLECTAAATCLDDHTVLGADGKEDHDCSPYICQAGACLNTCASVDDCFRDAICNSEQACVPAGAAQEDESVCACRGVGRPSQGHAGILLLILGSLFLGRRTSARPRGRS